MNNYLRVSCTILRAYDKIRRSCQCQRYWHYKWNEISWRLYNHFLGKTSRSLIIVRHIVHNPPGSVPVTELDLQWLNTETARWTGLPSISNLIETGSTVTFLFSLLFIFISITLSKISNVQLFHKPICG